MVPAALTQRPPSLPPSLSPDLPPSPPTFPQTPASPEFRHVMAQKRKSDVSYSVAGVLQRSLYRDASWKYHFQFKKDRLWKARRDEENIHQEIWSAGYQVY